MFDPRGDCAPPRAVNSDGVPSHSIRDPSSPGGSSRKACGGLWPTGNSDGPSVRFLFPELHMSAEAFLGALIALTIVLAFLCIEKE